MKILFLLYLVTFTKNTILAITSNQLLTDQLMPKIMFNNNVKEYFGCIVSKTLQYDSFEIICNITTIQNPLAGTCIGFNRFFSSPSICEIPIIPKDHSFSFTCDLTTTMYLDEKAKTLQETCFLNPTPLHLARPPFQCITPANGKTLTCLIPPIDMVQIITIKSKTNDDSGDDGIDTSNRNFNIIYYSFIMINFIFSAVLIFLIVYKTDQIKYLLSETTELDMNQTPMTYKNNA